MYTAFENFKMVMGWQRAAVITPKTVSVQFNRNSYDIIKSAGFTWADLEKNIEKMRECGKVLKNLAGVRSAMLLRGSAAQCADNKQHKPTGVHVCAGRDNVIHYVNEYTLAQVNARRPVQGSEPIRNFRARLYDVFPGVFNCGTESYASERVYESYTHQAFVSMFNDLDGNRA